MVKTISTVMLAAGIAGLIIGGPQAFAASSKDKSWPCIQRKVPEISPGMMWTGPEFKTDDKSWEKVKVIADLVKRTTSRRLSVDDAKTEIDKFLEGLKGQKNKSLTQLFAGQFQTINTERRNIIRGIGRYAQKQIVLAKGIKELTKELDALSANAKLTKKESARLDQINEKLSWDTRIFDEREQSLRYVCETPVLLEQRLFTLARHILQHLE